MKPSTIIGLAMFALLASLIAGVIYLYSDRQEQILLQEQAIEDRDAAREHKRLAENAIVLASENHSKDLENYNATITGRDDFIRNFAKSRARVEIASMEATTDRCYDHPLPVDVVDELCGIIDDLSTPSSMRGVQEGSTSADQTCFITARRLVKITTQFAEALVTSNANGAAIEQIQR